MLILVFWSTFESNISSNLLSNFGSSLFNAGDLVIFWVNFEVDFGSKGNSGILLSSGVGTCVLVGGNQFWSILASDLLRSY